MSDNVLLVVNDAPYATEKAFNALRLAIALQSRDNKVSVFLLGDAIYCALPSHEIPKGHFNIAEMVSRVISNGGRVAACGTCTKARGLKADGLLNGVEPGTMTMLSEWTEKSSKVHSF